jgi:hypothetical protein
MSDEDEHEHKTPLDGGIHMLKKNGGTHVVVTN